MKKFIKLFSIALMTCICFISNAQTQLFRWAMAPIQIEMPAATPVVSNIDAYTLMPAPQTVRVANGMYDDNNELLFYISDGNVYDKHSTLIGTINPLPVNAEVAIVPYGTNDECQKKFNIFSLGTAGFYQSVIRSVLDMQNYTLATNIVADVFNIQTEYGALAVSKAVYGTLGTDRLLFSIAASGFANGGEVRRLTIQNNGDVVNPVFFYQPPLYAGVNCFTMELDLSPDGKYLAWGSWLATSTSGINRYHLIELTSSGAFAAYNQFDISPAVPGNNVSGFRGVEFWMNPNTHINHLFIGAGSSGIFYTDPSLTSFPQVALSDPDYGISQIELSYNGLMYVSSDNTTGYIDAFNPGAFPPAMMGGANAFTFTNASGTAVTAPRVNSWTAIGEFFYTLPDQIDDEDYSTNLSAPVTQTGSTNTYDWNSGTTTWSYGIGNNPWDVASGGVQVIKELRVSNYSNLTIDAMLFKFSPQAMVVIEQGSSLTLNGTVFTSNALPHPCSVYTWIGVEVWGDKTLSQIPVTAQGKLTLINGSSIQYAQWGARAWNSFSHITTGGIIRASNSSFINNKIGVEFNPYQNLYALPPPSTKKLLLANQSSFTDCRFEADGTYPFTTAPTHVMINGCDGIVFSTCTLQVTSSANIWSGIGIRALDSRFIVKNNSIFNRLRHGIDAAGISGNQPFYVYSSFFNDNATSIYAYKINNMVVQDNDFDIGNNANPGAVVQNGMVMRNCSGFTIEENEFQATAIVLAGNTRGIFMNYSGSADNVIYKNYFDGLNYGNVAVFINRDMSNPTLHGLQYLCNENGTSTANIDNDFYTSTPGIRAIQGGTTYPAVNIFTSLAGGITYQINNTAPSVLDYYHSGIGNENPTQKWWVGSN